jgi:hypothetical protein
VNVGVAATAVAGRAAAGSVVLVADAALLVGPAAVVVTGNVVVVAGNVVVVVAAGSSTVNGTAV